MKGANDMGGRGKGRALVLAGVMAALSACGDGKPQQPAAVATAALPAGETLHLAATPVADTLAVSAEIATRDTAEALARIPGTLAVLTVRAGDMVRKGQTIGHISDSRLGYETYAAGAQVAAARAESVRAGAELARMRDLFNHGVYAQARLDQAVAAAGVADAHLAAARAREGASASVAGQGVVLAPASGRIVRADLPAGSVVAPGASIATVAAGPPVVRLLLPESVAGTVHTGTRVRLSAADLPDGPHEGAITEIFPAITAGQLRADASVPGLPTRYVGRRVGATVEIGTRKALVVPRRFVSRRYGMDQVMVVAADRQPAQVPVQTAPTANPDSIEILSGVVAGDTLFAAIPNAAAPATPAARAVRR